MIGYIVSDTDNGKEEIVGNYYLVTEDGELLSKGWATGRMDALVNLYVSNPDIVRKCAEKYGVFHVKYFSDSNMSSEELRCRYRAKNAKNDERMTNDSRVRSYELG